MPTWLQLVVTGLIGGVGSSLLTAIATALRTSKTETTARRLSFLESQIQKVYGPAYLEMLEIRRLMDLNDRYFQAWDKGNDLETEARSNGAEQAHLDRLHEDLMELWKIIRETLLHMEAKTAALHRIMHSNAAFVDPPDLPPGSWPI